MIEDEHIGDAWMDLNLFALFCFGFALHIDFYHKANFILPFYPACPKTL